MRPSSFILPAGICLLLSAPAIALMPVFTPPLNGCPCPEGLDVRTPFRNAGTLVGVVGLGLVLSGAVLRRGLREPTTGLRRNDEVTTAAFAGIALVVLSIIISQIVLRGPGWVIGLYEAQALYLGILGTGTLLFAGIASATGRKLGALFLSTGILLSGLSLLLSYTLSSDFSTRCSEDVCSPVLANSTVTDMTDLGYLLAVGAFLFALGLSMSLAKRANEGS